MTDYPRIAWPISGIGSGSMASRSSKTSWIAATTSRSLELWPVTSWTDSKRPRADG